MESLPTMNGETVETSGFNCEEIMRLWVLLDSLNKISSSKALTISGKSSFTFCINSLEMNLDNSWIIDSSAADHITPHSQYFKAYKPCSNNRKITMANGTSAIIAGVGNVFISQATN